MNWKTLIKAAVLLPVLFACSQEQATEPVPVPGAGGREIVLEASGESTGAKVTLDLPALLWEDTDRIAVFDGFSKYGFSIPEGGNHGSSATFRGEVSSSGGELYAVYPEEAGLGLESGRLTVRVPAAQTVPEGRTADPKALVAVGKADGTSLRFKNVPALLKVSIASSDISSVIICGSSIAGTAVVSPDGTTGSVSEGADRIELLPEGGVFAPGSYYAALLPGTTPSNGFSITLVRSDGLSATRTASREVVFRRNKGLDAGSIESVAKWERVILTKQQLFDWNERRDPADASDEVKLGADIDLEGEPWTPKNFAGTFDGCGHRISGLKVSGSSYVGFLREITGSAVVKNVVIGSRDGSTYDGVSIISHSAPSNNYTWYYAGAVAKVSGTARVSDVVNFATVEVASGSVSKTRIGGLVGNWASSAPCEGLVNRGTVRNAASKTGQASSSDATLSSSLVGGVVGFLDVRTSVSGCHNFGSVSTTNPGVSSVGGVVGYDGRGSAISGCTNAGAVSHDASEAITAESAAAGIIAYAKGVSGTFGSLTSCSNSGPVSASCGGKNFRLAGVSGYTEYYTVSGCTNTGSISFDGNTTEGGFLAIGGVVAHTYSGCLVEDCRNDGPVSSNRLQVNRIGGVMGDLNNSAIRNCTNAGAVTLDNSSQAITGWQGAGGIAGFSEGNGSAREISGCTNEGAVSVTVNTIGNSTYHRCGAGGILGMPYTTMSIADCINRGDVSLENKHASAPYAYAGGIFGQDTGASSTCGVSSCTNYGTVRLLSGRSGYCGAGGLFGSVTMAASLQGNSNFGSVEGAVAGAVAGISTLDFSAVVCDALTVNGTAYGSASDKDAWACPKSSGTIALVVKKHTPDETGGLPKPLEPGNKVVAHRGGSTECGYPDNSRAALRYAMSLGCYGSECDIYWTKDDKVIVAHADSECRVNGLHPWEATAAEIIAVKRLSNYEKIPTLEEYIDVVMSEGSKTKLVVDIKMITSPSMNYDYPAKAALKAIEIVQEKNAQNFVEFICTGYDQVMSKIAASMKAAGLACGWMNGSISASTFKSRGYTNWANLNTREHFSLGSGDDKGIGNRTISEFKNAGLQLSVFHIDKQSGNSSAVYTDATVKEFLDEYQYLRCITTNYPSWLLQKTKGL